MSQDYLEMVCLVKDIQIPRGRVAIITGAEGILHLILNLYTNDLLNQMSKVHKCRQYTSTNAGREIYLNGMEPHDIGSDGSVLPSLASQTQCGNDWV